MAPWSFALLLAAITAADGAPPPAAPEAAATAAAPPAARGDLEAPVQGSYVTLGAGPTAMVLGARLPADPAFPALGGAAELLGAGGLLALAAGLDLHPLLAAEAALGLDVHDTRRRDRVRGLGIGYASVGVRLRLPVTPRLTLALAPHLGVARLDDAVAPPRASGVLHVALAAEYAVHVQHVTVGLALAAIVPWSPLRVALGLLPQFRYTF